MLRDVLGSWIDSLGERDFDVPFMHLIRGMGFFDIHLTHGQFEFGKDFIAKRVEGGSTVQYAFQSKAGDIDGAGWTNMLGQLEELVGCWLVHPNYDRTLRQESRLVMTGRLKGKAPASAQQYKDRLGKRDSISFDTWDRDTLLDFLQETDPRELSIILSQDFKRLTASIEAGSISGQWLEESLSALGPSQVPAPHETHRPLLEVSVLVAHFTSLDRIFEAITCSAHAVRVAAMSAYSETTPREESTSIIHRTLRSHFATASRLIDHYSVHTLEPIALAESSGGCSALVTYPVACLRILETLGLQGIWAYEQGEHAEFDRLLGILTDFLERHPGCTKPISDRFAVSLPPPIICLHLGGKHQPIHFLLKETTKWVCDRYERSEFGLASPYATPKEEIEILVGAPFEFVDLRTRRESMIAAALADLAFQFCPNLYPDIVNDIQAVGIAPSFYFPHDSVKSLFQGRGAIHSLVNIDYPEDTAHQTPSHLAHGTRKLEEVGGLTLPLVISTVQRDRMFPDIYSRVPVPLG